MIFVESFTIADIGQANRVGDIKGLARYLVIGVRRLLRRRGLDVVFVMMLSGTSVIRIVAVLFPLECQLDRAFGVIVSIPFVAIHAGCLDYAAYLVGVACPEHNEIAEGKIGL